MLLLLQRPRSHMQNFPVPFTPQQTELKHAAEKRYLCFATFEKTKVYKTRLMKLQGVLNWKYEFKYTVSLFLSLCMIPPRFGQVGVNGTGVHSQTRDVIQIFDSDSTFILIYFI